MAGQGRTYTLQEYGETVLILHRAGHIREKEVLLYLYRAKDLWAEDRAAFAAHVEDTLGEWHGVEGT